MRKRLGHCQSPGREIQNRLIVDLQPETDHFGEVRTQGGDVGFGMDERELGEALKDLQDGFARVQAQIHVLRLALQGLQTESDIRALLSQLNAIEDELHQSEGFLKSRGHHH